jgi:hypothetical protein
MMGGNQDRKAEQAGYAVEFKDATYTDTQLAAIRDDPEARLRWAWGLIRPKPNPQTKAYSKWTSEFHNVVKWLHGEIDKPNRDTKHHSS